MKIKISIVYLMMRASGDGIRRDCEWIDLIKKIDQISSATEHEQRAVTFPL